MPDRLMVPRPLPSHLFGLAALLLLIVVTAPVAAVLFSMSPLEAVATLHADGADALRVSFVASLAATITATLLGVPAGYFLSTAPRKLRAIAIFVLALPLAFPPVASGLMLVYVFGAHAPLGAWLASNGIMVLDSLTGVSLAEFFVSGSFVAIAATAAFAALDPIYQDAARTLGASEWRIFGRIALPNAAGGVGAGITFAWLRAIGEYGATSIVAFHPTSLPVALYVALSASGVREALAFSYSFIVLAGAVLAATWILRRGVVV